MATQSGLKSSQCSLLATLHHTIEALCSSCIFTFQLFIYQLVSVLDLHQINSLGFKAKRYQAHLTALLIFPHQTVGQNVSFRHLSKPWELERRMVCHLSEFFLFQPHHQLLHHCASCKLIVRQLLATYYTHSLSIYITEAGSLWEVLTLEMGGCHTTDLPTCGILTHVTLDPPTLNSLLRPWNNKIVSTLVFYQAHLHPLHPCGI